MGEHCGQRKKNNHLKFLFRRFVEITLTSTKIKMANRIHLLIVICAISCWASSEGKPSKVLKAIEKDVDPSQSNSLEERVGGNPIKNAKKCGSCYGAETCNKLGIECCNTCEDLRRAYEDYPLSGPDKYDGCYY